MIDFKLLENEYNKRIVDALCEADVRDIAKSMIYSLARRYNNVCAELESLKDLAGFNKPFPFLRLPREIRDDIYGYALRAQVAVDVNPNPHYLPTERHRRLPPAPCLLLVNKQVYHESVAVLYSTNSFSFSEAGHLFAWGQKIGPRNCERVTRVRIWVRFAGFHDLEEDPKSLQPSEYQSWSSHWIAGLDACNLGQVKHLALEGEPGCYPAFLLAMPADLQQCVERFLGRAADETAASLLLKGFLEEEREKFPREWKVDIEPWDSNEFDAETMREMREGLMAEFTFQPTFSY